jgi:hypothetical protein
MMRNRIRGVVTNGFYITRFICIAAIIFPFIIFHTIAYIPYFKNNQIPLSDNEKAYVSSSFSANRNLNEQSILFNANPNDYYAIVSKEGVKLVYTPNPNLDPLIYSNNLAYEKAKQEGEMEYSLYAKGIGDRRYQVVGGALDGDKLIYEVDENLYPIGILGQSLTEYSFFGNQNQLVYSIIDLDDQNGVDFINKSIIEDSPTLLSYGLTAMNGNARDFKNIGINDSWSNQEKDLHRYRAMPFDGINGYYSELPMLPTIATARDIGNVGAGYVIKNRGMEWETARKFFDWYQGSVEETPSQKAQRFGYDLASSPAQN